MPAKINIDLLAAIRIEFESGLQPGLVHKHLSSNGTPVCRVHVYRLYNRWRASGELVAKREAPAGRRPALVSYILEVCPCFC